MLRIPPSNRCWRQALTGALLGVVLLALLIPAAPAGTACILKPLQPDALANAARLGVKVFEALEQSAAQVAIVGRVGTDLSKYGLRFSHLGFAVRDHRQGRWTLVHLLNRCGTAESSLYDEGLINFFLDNPFAYEAVIATPKPELQEALFKVLRSATKPEIKAAVELMFKVEVESVRTLNVKGRAKRFGRSLGRRNHVKKAYVSLKAGQELNFVGEGA